MLGQKILPYFMPEASNIQRLEILLAAERKYGAVGSPLLRLAALLPKGVANAAHVAQRAKMSKRESDQLGLLATVPERLRGKLDPIPFRRVIYEYGPEVAREAAFLLAVEDRGADLDPALAEAADWRNPKFPLQGEDILQLGEKPGPKVGEILRAVEDWWIAQDFRPNRAECLGEAKKRLNAG
jgi:poly(A) polymerase